MPSNHLIPCHPLLPPSVFPSIRVFSNESVTVFTVSPSICHEVVGSDPLIFIFECWVLSQLFHSPLSLLSRSTLVLFTFCHKGGVIWISVVIELLLAILFLDCASSSPALLMMYSAYMLNKQGDNIWPWHISSQFANSLFFQAPVLSVVSWPAYRFLRRQARWPGIPISWRIYQFVVIHTKDLT